MSKAAQLAALIGGTSGSSLSNRNMIINGAMLVFQRGTASTGNNAYSVDRWQHKDAASTVAMTITQDTDVPTGQGFYYSLKASTTANVTANGFLGIAQRMEGYNINPLAWGTSGAKQATLSFWVKSSTAGTYGLSSRNNAVDRSCVMEYTINAADTWEYKTVTFPAETSGTWETTTNIGNRLWWGLSATGGITSTIGSWQNANLYQSSNNVDWSGSTATATFYITGVQLEIGEQATPFEHESYAATLQKCQRYYYQTVYKGSSDTTYAIGVAANSATAAQCMTPFPVTMRAAPTFAVGGDVAVYDGDSVNTITGISANGSSTTSGTFNVDGSGLTTGRGVAIIANASSEFLSFSSEL